MWKKIFELGRNFFRQLSRKEIFFFWLAQALVLHFFHEPWRDEAQAWLVARSSDSLQELLYRSSLEATGPLYYLLLWPFAHFDPTGFEFWIWILSFSGTAAFVASLIKSEILPKKILVLFIFSHLVGYELAVVSRLYGWGLFFLLLGVSSDLRHKKYAAFFAFSCAMLIQLNFVFAVFAWVLYRSFEGLRQKSWRNLRWSFLLLLPLLLLLWHFSLASSVRVWSEIRGTLKGSNLGSTLMMLCAPTPGRIGWGGLVFFALALRALGKSRALIAWTLGALPFLFLFLFVSAEAEARARHGAALNFLLVIFCVLLKRSSLLYPLLIVTFIAGLASRAQDFLHPYSEGRAVAELISKSHPRSEDRVLISDDDVSGFVVSVILDQAFYSGRDGRLIEYPQFTRERFAIAEKTEKDFLLERRHWELCGQSQACFVISKRPIVLDSALSGNLCLENLKEANAKTITDERFHLSRFTRCQN